MTHLDDEELELESESESLSYIVSSLASLLPRCSMLSCCSAELLRITDESDVPAFRPRGAFDLADPALRTSPPSSRAGSRLRAVGSSPGTDRDDSLRTAGPREDGGGGGAVGLGSSQGAGDSDDSLVALAARAAGLPERGEQVMRIRIFFPGAAAAGDGSPASAHGALGILILRRVDDGLPRSVMSATSSSLSLAVGSSALLSAGLGSLIRM